MISTDDNVLTLECSRKSSDVMQKNEVSHKQASSNVVFVQIKMSPF